MFKKLIIRKKIKFNKKLNLIGTKLLIAGIFFISFAMPCYASGMQAYQALPAQPKVVVPYVGFDIGYGWSQFKYKTDNSPSVPHSWSDSFPNKSFDNVFLGGIVGTQFNIPSYEQIFLATQLTFDFYPEGYSYTNKNYASGGGGPGSTAYGGLNQKWQGGLSLLAGYHVTSTITPYLIGGITYNGFSSKYKYTMGGNGTTASDSKNFEEFGWLVGVGIENKFTNHLALRLEYNYQDYNNYSYTSTESVGAFATIKVKHKISFDGNNVIRANLLWYF